MITHFAELRLNTVSLQGVRQFYGDLLGFPIAQESEQEISFQPTPFTSLTFAEVCEPMAPAHFAFEVPYSQFASAVAFLKDRARIPLTRWPDGREVGEFATGVNAYFRDGDGHLLEIIAHRYVREDVLPAQGDLKVLYLREIGFPVDSVPECREWLAKLFGMKPDKVYDDFTFAIGGTAHAVLASKRRRWIPINMYALPPSMTVSFGVSDRDSLERARKRLGEADIVSAGGDDIVFNRYGYRMRLAVTDFAPDIPARLQLPYSI